MSAKEYFDNVADTWDQKFLTSALSTFLENFVPQFGIKLGQNILDVGTGTGVLIPFLVKAVGSAGSVYAIDVSEKMVQNFNKKHGHQKNVQVNVANIEDVAFLPQTFDAVVCFGVFPHIDNKPKALQNINRILKPNGALVIAHALSSEELKMHHKKVSHRVEHSVLPKNAEMTQLLEQAGFTDISIKDEPGCYLCISRKA
ncbi:MAG: class I SAM-dependent methyltransferase [Candidatus Bathyarchaeia archaeon]|jgi:ubiquinone/menaquinone biosynthesis C-methylase UbiE